MMLGLGETTRSIQPYGPAVPLDYVSQPFNCPPGSDFTKSQEVGMCVGADYSPIARVAADGTRVYYDLTGQVGGVELGGGSDGWIKGVPNAAVLGALGLLLAMKLAK